MSNIYTFVVVDDKNQTLVCRAERFQALRNLSYFRGQGKRCKLILETVSGADWRLVSTERDVIGYDEPCEVTA